MSQFHSFILIILFLSVTHRIYSRVAAGNSRGGIYRESFIIWLPWYPSFVVLVVAHLLFILYVQPCTYSPFFYTLICNLLSKNKKRKLLLADLQMLINAFHAHVIKFWVLFWKQKMIQCVQRIYIYIYTTSHIKIILSDLPTFYIYQSLLSWYLNQIYFP